MVLPFFIENVAFNTFQGDKSNKELLL